MGEAGAAAGAGGQKADPVRLFRRRAGRSTSEPGGPRRDSLREDARDVDDEDLDAENEEIDLTDYSPWYYTYVNSTNQTIDYRRTGTGNIRVCNNGEEPRPTKDMYCMENRLNKKTVILQSGSWIESVIIMWIAEILMREQWKKI